MGSPVHKGLSYLARIQVTEEVKTRLHFLCPSVQSSLLLKTSAPGLAEKRDARPAIEKIAVGIHSSSFQSCP